MGKIRKRSMRCNVKKKKTKSDYFKGRLQAMRNNLKCNRDADTEKGLVYTAREGEAG